LAETPSIISRSADIPVSLGKFVVEEQLLKEPEEYLLLWQEVFWRNGSGFRIVKNIKQRRAKIVNEEDTKIFSFSYLHPNQVKDLYVVFRLCDDDMERFKRYLRSVGFSWRFEYGDLIDKFNAVSIEHDRRRTRRELSCHCTIC
jgi:hypothetical protein